MASSAEPGSGALLGGQGEAEHVVAAKAVTAGV